MLSARELNPDLVVADIGMPALNGPDAAEELKHSMPNVRFVFLTMMDDPRLASAALRLAPVGYVLKHSAVDELLAAIDDAGEVMNAVASGTDSEAALAKLSIPEERRKAILQLLLAIGYLRESEHRYAVGVPILTENDKPLADAALKLSREIMTDWLHRNYPSMKDQLAGLSPMRNGVPFALAFSEAWHYTFGFATKSLAESGFYANPRAAGNRYEGYVPLVWTSSALKLPGQ
jgi:CheY-like chemotaxis protein